MINKIFVSLILLFVLNCKSTQNQEKIVEQDSVLIGKGNLYGSGDEGIEKQNSIITDENDWQDLLAKMNSVNNVSDGFSETKIDFSKYTIIAIFDTVKTSGGHSLELDVKPNSETIEIHINGKSPEGMASMAMTQPYYIVKIPKNDLPIVFK
jgi:hypothetical protein